VTGVGKIGDIFAGCDIDDSYPTRSNADGLARTIALAQEGREGLVFVNLVETDQTYGHRNDPEGFHRCLQEIDAAIPDLRAALGPDDLLVLTSDHGCDPTTASTDHSREYALLVAHVPGQEPGGHRDGEFSDVGATVAAWLGARTGDGLPGTPIDL
jgi:phosphopentomutase